MCPIAFLAATKQLYEWDRRTDWKKIADFDPNFAFPDSNSSLNFHPWLLNDAQSLTQYRRGSLLFSKAIHQISRSHGTKKSPILTLIENFRIVTQVWINRWLWNDAQSLT